ncbi:SRPBCC family protein [soil metagenome]
MTARTVEHATFTIERTYQAAPNRVFAAWATPESKARWFAPDATEHTMDFRAGGAERNSGDGDPDGPLLVFESTYHDIVEAERIVFSSSLLTDGAVVTVSLTTVELRPDDGRTHLVLTQHSAFLDGHEQPSWREAGTRSQLDALDAELAA